MKRRIRKILDDILADADFWETTLRGLVRRMQSDKRKGRNRHVSVGDLLTDRMDTARRYGWGEGTSCYDNVLVLGNVKVGEHTWIGPNTVLDGSGGLEIGDYCSISAGVQIYTKNTVNWAVSMGKAVVIPREPTKIGSGVYIGPNAVIGMGVTIGDGAIIGPLTFVHEDVPAGGALVSRPGPRPKEGADG